MDGEADVNRILFEPLPELWRRPPGRPCSTWLKNMNGDLTSFDMELLEARDAAQNRTFLENAGFVQLYVPIVMHANIGLDWKTPWRRQAITTGGSLLVTVY